MRIGLYGGSFNPPHDGHAHVSQVALRRLKLHRIWWLVTPGNPLKDASDLATLDARMRAARALTRDRRVVVTALEADIGTTRTLSMLRWLKRHAPRVHFVWVMGADNLAGFHRWHGWREIVAEIPIAVVDRPGFTLPALTSPAARVLANDQLDEDDATRLAVMRPPAWTFLRAPLNPLSSTDLRQQDSC